MPSQPCCASKEGSPSSSPTDRPQESHYQEDIKTMSLGVAKSLDFKSPTIFKIQTKPIKPRGSQKRVVTVTVNTTSCFLLPTRWQS